MLVSLRNVSEYVNLGSLTPEEIAHGLTFAGVEVEEISYMAKGTNLVIGKILECEAHPDSNHLHILKVDLGSKYGVEQIVCGAPNARVGLKVIVARVGAVLPKIEIKKGVIRGVESNGMCCSLLELGVDEKYLSDAQKAGIEELPEDAPVGEENVLGYLGLDDVVLNISVLANRPDLLSVYNVSREIAAIFSLKANIASFENKTDFQTSLKVGSATSRCSQFASKEMIGIKVANSPKWMANYLNAMGVRSINNIVDIGNYVMLMTGQPLHMYDADKLVKAELVARDDYNDKFVALDEKEYDIVPGDVVITSNGVPMCLGGVMGSLECAVDEKTTHIYIESASFDGASIRHTSNRLGLTSESSMRFVKGTNHFQAEDVLNFTADLIKKYCSAEKESNIVAYQKDEYKTNVINTSVKKVNALIGTSFSFDEINNVLNRLNFTVNSKDKETLEITVPQYRLDISGSADISEEVIRILGYSNVKDELPCLNVKVGALSLEQKRMKDIRNFLLENGLDECLTYSLVSEKEVNLFKFIDGGDHYKILNPLTDDRTCFRTNILHSLMKSASYNIARQNKNLALFETSHVQTKKGISDQLAIVLVGKKEQHSLMSMENYDFYDMKGLIEGIFEILGVETSRYKIERISDCPSELHPGKSAQIVFQGNIIGKFGELHPNYYSIYDLGKTSCVVLEMDLNILLSCKTSIAKMTAINKYPYVTRDISFLLKKEITAADIIKCIKVEGKGIVSDAVVFDIYEGEHIASDMKSIAITIKYENFNSTLTEKEVNDVEERIKFALTKNFRVEFRA